MMNPVATSGRESPVTTKDGQGEKHPEVGASDHGFVSPVAQSSASAHTDPTTEERKAPLRLYHSLMVFTTPRALFARVEDTGQYGSTLIVMLGFVMLLGYAQIQTGLIDRSVDQQTELTLADIETEQAGLIDRVELRDRMDQARKEGEFNKTIFRLGAVVDKPVYFLSSFLLIASILYAVVALTGRKPEYNTLMSICVYAGLIELAGVALQLAMMVTYETGMVNTSLGMFDPIDKPSILSAIDPYRCWFWILVAVGVTVTHQLSRRMAIVTCALCALVATAARAIPVIIAQQLAAGA